MFLQRVKDIAVNGANFYQPTMTIGQNPSVDAVTKSFLLNELSIKDAPVAVRTGKQFGQVVFV